MTAQVSFDEADVLVRQLAPDDVESAVVLSSTAGWNQRVPDWRMLLGLAGRGAFAAVSGGRLVGTAMGIDYGGFSWIAMMLVDPAYRGRGLGARLLEAALDAVPDDTPVRLDATPMGRPLYERYGFEHEATLKRVLAPAGRAVAGAGASDVRVRRLVPADLSRIGDLDRDVFGGGRRAVLEWALEAAPEYAYVVDAPEPSGYALGRPGRLFDQLGPVVAADEAIARALVNAALASVRGTPVVMDTFDRRESFGAWLEAGGFAAQRPLFRMRRQPRAAAPSRGVPPVPTLSEFAIVGPEFA